MGPMAPKVLVVPDVLSKVPIVLMVSIVLI